MPEQKINHLAVVIAAIVHFAIGAFWFTAFAKPWIAGLRMTPEEITYAQTHMSPVPYAAAFACNLLIAYALAWVITRSGKQTLVRGLSIGLALGFAIAAAAIATELAFERRTPSFIAISAGYPVLGMMLMGGLIGAWKKKSAAEPLTSAVGA